MRMVSFVILAYAVATDVVTESLKFTLTKGSLYSYWIAKSDTVSTRRASNDE